MSKATTQLVAQAEPAGLAPVDTAAATPDDYQQIVMDAFAPLGPDAQSWAVRVSRCESGFNSNAVNPYSGASGLFQFLPSTWARTPYADQSPFDPVANAHAAAWLYSRSGAAAWSCK